MLALFGIDGLRTTLITENTAQKIKFSIKDFFIKCDQTRRKLWIWSHVGKKFSIENFIFYAVKKFLNVRTKNCQQD